MSIYIDYNRMGFKNRSVRPIYLNISIYLFGRFDATLEIISAHYSDTNKKIFRWKYGSISLKGGLKKDGTYTRQFQYYRWLPKSL